MHIQDWLARLLARPAADPVDWDSYTVSMAEPTWKALWREIEASQAYEDGLELGLRLLRATHQHRQKLTVRAYEATQMRLYRSILEMLDKAERWDAYLAAWETILTRTALCLSLKGNATDEDARLAPLVRRADGGLGAGPLPYGAARPERIDVHFLHTQLGRKAVIARRLAQQNGKRSADEHPAGRGGLPVPEIERRLVEA